MSQTSADYRPNASHCRGRTARVLAGDIVATLPQPPFDNSAMDGFALRHADLRGDGETILQLVGEQFAGASLDLRIESRAVHAHHHRRAACRSAPIPW